MYIIANKATFMVSNTITAIIKNNIKARLSSQRARQQVKKVGNGLSKDKIEKYYGSKSNLTKAVDNISFNVKSKEFVGIMGASGSGKTTLLSILCGRNSNYTGIFKINGKEVSDSSLRLLIYK